MSEALPHEDLADLYENAPCGYLSIAPDAKVAKVNRTLADWLGRDAAAIIGCSLHELLTFGGKIAYETHLAPLLRLQGFVHEIALDLVHADGSAMPVIANAAERRNAAGQHQFTRLTLFKAVDRRKYERSLVEARLRAEVSAADEVETARLREQFIAVLGHDLRAPLSALLAGVDMLERRENLSERGLRVVHEMRATVARGSALIENVLDFARGRLGGGIGIVCDSEAPLTPVLEQVVAEMRAFAPKRSILADFALSEPLMCDRARIAQLLQNLLSNALQHSAADSPVTVTGRCDDGRFTLNVSNLGAPIPEDARAHLFKPFVRGKVGRNRNGLGLGLFIVNEIASEHGGAMAVTSDAQATSFTFIMPLHPA